MWVNHYCVIVAVYRSRIRAFNSDINGRLTTGAKSDQSELRPKLSVITDTDSEGFEFHLRRIILVTAFKLIRTSIACLSLFELQSIYITINSYKNLNNIHI